MQIRSQSSSWYDVLAFLSLAAGLGLACGIALGGIALLLASPAYGAPASEVEEGALFLRARQLAADSGSVAPIQAVLVSTDVQFRVSGPIARARVVQIFHNPRADWYEGVYALPVPENAAIDRLRLRIGERIMENAVHERAASIFTASIADIGPRQTVVVELEYRQFLHHDDSLFSPRLPMVVAPRHVRTGPL